MAAFHHFCLIRWISLASIDRKWRRLNQRLHLRRVVEPQSVLAEPGYKLAMRRELSHTQPRSERLAPLANHDDAFDPSRATFAAFSEAELRLPCANQFYIDLGENLGVQQCAGLPSVAMVESIPPPQIVDAIPRGQIVEPVRACGVLATC